MKNKSFVFPLWVLMAGLGALLALDPHVSGFTFWAKLAFVVMAATGLDLIRKFSSKKPELCKQRAQIRKRR
jgi:hypothetical protein